MVDEPGRMQVGARDALDRLQASARDGTLDQICGRCGVALLTAFGSAVRRRVPAGGEPDTTPHDLDLGVAFVGRPQPVRLLDELTRVFGYDRIDLAVLDGAEPTIRSEALSGVALFEHQAGAFAVAQMAAVSERWDTAWLRRLDLQAMAR
jgi:predicted nucleotidyltransferase